MSCPDGPQTSRASAVTYDRGVPPRSPLPQRLGLDPAWMRTPDLDRSRPDPWPSMGAWLGERLSEFLDVAAFLAAGRFVYQSGSPVSGTDPYRPHTFVWFHRDLRDEVPVPGAIHVISQDERIVVVTDPASAVFMMSPVGHGSRLCGP